MKIEKGNQVKIVSVDIMQVELDRMFADGWVTTQIEGHPGNGETYIVEFTKKEGGE